MYRQGAPCEFCDAVADGFCPRCQCHVCPHHGLDGGAYCTMCSKERRDDADVARFRSDVVAPVDEARLQLRRSIPLGEMILGALGRLFLRANAPVVREPRFDERTPEQIRAWRVSAGVAKRRHSR